MRRIEQSILGPLYALAVGLRRTLWRIQRPMAVGVRVLIVHEGTALLVRHRAGHAPWGLPGGGVKRYERLSEAARREALEETGVPVRIERLLGLYDNFHDGFSNYIAVFVGTPLGAPRPPVSLEIAEVRFFPLDAPPPQIDRGSRRRLDDYRNGVAGISGNW